MNLGSSMQLPFLDELEKISATRAVKEFIRQAKREYPNFLRQVKMYQKFKHKHRQKPTPYGALAYIGRDKAPSEKLLRLGHAAYGGQYGGTLQNLAPIRRGHLEFVGVPKKVGAEYKKLRRPKTKMEKALYEQEVARHWSGRHVPKAEEVFIPAGATAESSFLAVPRKGKLLFRGNKPPRKSRSITMSEHPDVAAGYATGMSHLQMTGPQGELYVFRKKGLRGVRTASGLYGKGSQMEHAPSRVFREPRVVRERVLRMGEGDVRAGLNPTYETVVKAGRKLREVGKYKVRAARQGAMPGYAVSRIRGANPENIFRA